ncbi:alpha/beta fold hydrolase [Paenibacillus sp. XY044]|uniref:alpha/beta fold hydrolase n=1 Tax=Paenibacillus sp. XY044 TaxID=2026089 RepID=UPI000B97E662|nr:alpha/beta hydrolase [Paenibacillus sp. XY044]OZB94324.1 hypothetical protein CJP46_19165 [Paenibacillus sp. XY044]
MELRADQGSMGTVRANDGTVIGYRVMGAGPGLLIIHGAFRASQHYLQLARELSDTFTVYVMDRRGRNGSGAKGDAYSLATECADAAAIMDQHGISLLFGHSYGAVVALQLAKHRPLTKVALYEPPMMRYFPSEWLPTFEREMQREDYAAASVTFLKGMRMGGWLGRLPKPLLNLMFRKMAKGEEWEENVQLLRTVPKEIRAVLREDFGIDQYREVKVPVLLMTGTKSPGYLHEAAAALESCLPDRQVVSLEGLHHNAPDDQAPGQIAGLIKGFME